MKNLIIGIIALVLIINIGAFVLSHKNDQALSSNITTNTSEYNQTTDQDNENNSTIASQEDYNEERVDDNSQTTDQDNENNGTIASQGDYNEAREDDNSQTTDQDDVNNGTIASQGVYNEAREDDHSQATDQSDISYGNVTPQGVYNETKVDNNNQTTGQSNISYNNVTPQEVYNETKIDNQITDQNNTWYDDSLSWGDVASAFLASYKQIIVDETQQYQRDYNGAKEILKELGYRFPTEAEFELMYRLWRRGYETGLGDSNAA